jgi:hypothetical protein
MDHGQAPTHSGDRRRGPRGHNRVAAIATDIESVTERAGAALDWPARVLEVQVVATASVNGPRRREGAMLLLKPQERGGALCAVHIKDDESTCSSSTDA